MTATAFDLTTAPTYAIYQSADGLRLEMGAVLVVPSVGHRVTIGSRRYVVEAVVWDVFDSAAPGEPPGGIYPQQHATILLDPAQ